MRALNWRRRGALLVAITTVLFALFAGRGAAAIEGWALQFLPQYADVQLSPDGVHLAAIQPVIGAGSVAIYTRGGSKPCVFAPSDVKVRSIVWGNNNRLLVRVSLTRTPIGFAHAVEYYRFISLKSDCTNPVLMLRGRMETDLNPLSGDVMRVSPQDDSTVLFNVFSVGMQRRDHDAFMRTLSAWRYSFDLLRVNLETGESQTIEQGSQNTVGWLADERGEAHVRVDLNMESGRVSAYSRPSQSSSWGQAYAHEYSERATRGMSFEGLSASDPNTAYVLARTGGPRVSAFEYDLRSGALGRRLDHDQSLSVDRFLRDPLTKTPIGLVYFRPLPPIDKFVEQPGEQYTVVSEPQPDKPQVEIFDPEWQSLYGSVQAAFPDENVVITSITRDHRMLTAFVDGAADHGGAYYLVDLTGSKVWKIGSRFEETVAGGVLPSRSITFQGRDGLSIPAQLTLPPHRDGRAVPLMVMWQGGGEAEGGLAFADWRAQAMAHQGYAVLVPQFRGTDGLGMTPLRRVSQALRDDVSAGVVQLAARGIVDAQRACFVSGAGSLTAPIEDFSPTPNPTNEERQPLSLYLCMSAPAF